MKVQSFYRWLHIIRIILSLWQFCFKYAFQLETTDTTLKEQEVSAPVMQNNCSLFLSLSFSSPVPFIPISFSLSFSQYVFTCYTNFGVMWFKILKYHLCDETIIAFYG